MEYETKLSFITLVNQILTAKTTPPSAPLLSKEGSKGQSDTSLPVRDRLTASALAQAGTQTGALERQIDEMVYKLYGLTEEEIEIVEGKG